MITDTLKTESRRCLLLVGGDRFTHDADAGSPGSNLVETKVMSSSTISDAKNGAIFMRCDLKDFFLALPMKEIEYTNALIRYFPPEIIQQ